MCEHSFKCLWCEQPLNIQADRSFNRNGISRSSFRRSSLETSWTFPQSFVIQKKKKKKKTCKKVRWLRSWLCLWYFGTHNIMQPDYLTLLPTSTMGNQICNQWIPSIVILQFPCKWNVTFMFQMDGENDHWIVGSSKYSQYTNCSKY